MKFALYFAAAICLSLAYQGILGQGVKFSANRRIDGRAGKVLGVLFLLLSVAFGLLGALFDHLIGRLH